MSNLHAMKKRTQLEPGEPLSSWVKKEDVERCLREDAILEDLEILEDLDNETR